MADMIERRRSPRAELQTNQVVRVQLRHRVHLVDISRSGALLACETPLPVGTQGQVHCALAALPFTAQIAVRRHLPRPTSAGQVGLGAEFGTVDDRSRQHLDQFLRRGKN